MNDRHTQFQNWRNQIASRKLDFDIREGEFDNHAQIIKAKNSSKEEEMTRKLLNSITIALIAICVFQSVIFGFILKSLDLVPITLAAVILIGIVGRVIYGDQIRIEDAINKNTFAIKNNMAFFIRASYSKSLNSPFEQSLHGYVKIGKEDVFSLDGLEFGNIRYETDGRNSVVYRKFYVEQLLPFKVQSLAIDSLREKGFGIMRLNNPNLVSLPGDFDKFFTVETEDFYKSQAVSFFAPDLMAEMIDHFQDCEIEFFDDKIRFIFAKSGERMEYIEEKYLLADSFLKRFADRIKLLEVTRKEEAVAATNNAHELLRNDFRHSNMYVICFAVWFLIALIGCFLMVRNISIVAALFASLFVSALFGSISGIILGIIKDNSIEKKARSLNSKSTEVVKRTIVQAISIVVILMIAFGLAKMTSVTTPEKSQQVVSEKRNAGRSNNSTAGNFKSEQIRRFSEVLEEVSLMKNSGDIIWGINSAKILKDNLNKKGKFNISEMVEYIDVEAGMAIESGRIYILRGVSCLENGFVTTRTPNPGVVLMTITSENSGECKPI